MTRMALGLLIACGLNWGGFLFAAEGVAGATGPRNNPAEAELIAPGTPTNASANGAVEAEKAVAAPGKVKIGAATPQPKNSPPPAAAPVRRGALRAAIRKNLQENEALRSTLQGIVQNQLGPMLRNSGLGNGLPGIGAPSAAMPGTNPTSPVPSGAANPPAAGSSGLEKNSSEVIPAGNTSEKK